MEDDQTLQQQEGEGGEEEEDVEGGDDGAGGGEETEDCHDVAETEADLEPNLRHVIRVQTTEMEKLENFESREPLGQHTVGNILCIVQYVRGLCNCKIINYFV